MATAPPSPLLTAPIGPTLLRLAAPNIISMVMYSLTMMTEAFYVGQLGTAPLAGLALAFPMMMLMGMLSAGAFGGTITGALSRRLGAGDRAGAEELAVHAVLLMVVLASLCSLVFLQFGRTIYGALGGSGVVLEQALAYSDTLFLGCASLWLSNALAGIVRATGNMAVAAKIAVFGSLLQISIAGVLVFGLGPFPAMGLLAALFPGLWANLFTSDAAVRAACNAYLHIVAPFYAFFGVATCLYFASQGAGRVLWPVIAAVMRVLVVIAGSIALASEAGAQPMHYFIVIAAGMVVHAVVSASAIRLGAWTQGNPLAAAR